MIFWLVLQLEISYKVCNILKDFWFLVEDFWKIIIFFQGEKYLSFHNSSFPLRYFLNVKWQGHSLTHPLVYKHNGEYEKCTRGKNKMKTNNLQNVKLVYACVQGPYRGGDFYHIIKFPSIIGEKYTRAPYNLKIWDPQPQLPLWGRYPTNFLDLSCLQFLQRSLQGPYPQH